MRQDSHHLGDFWGRYDLLKWCMCNLPQGDSLHHQLILIGWSLKSPSNDMILDSIES